MPFGNTALEDFVLSNQEIGGGTNRAFRGSQVSDRKAALLTYLKKEAEIRKKEEDKLALQERQQVRLFDENRDPLVFNPWSDSIVKRVIASKGTGSSGVKGMRWVAADPHPLRTTLEGIADTARAVKEEPYMSGRMMALGLMQGPVKAVGGFIEGYTNDPTFQNRQSSRVLDSLSQEEPIMSMKEYENTLPFGVKDAGDANFRRARYEQYKQSVRDYNVKNKQVADIMRPEFTSDATWADYVDAASWFVPDPTKTVRSGIKGAIVAKDIANMLRAARGARRVGSLAERAAM